MFRDNHLSFLNCTECDTSIVFCRLINGNEAPKQRLYIVRALHALAMKACAQAPTMDQKLLAEILNSTMDACAISGTCQQVQEVCMRTWKRNAMDVAKKFSRHQKSLWSSNYVRAYSSIYQHMDISVCIRISNTYMIVGVWAMYNNFNT